MENCTDELLAPVPLSATNCQIKLKLELLTRLRIAEAQIMTANMMNEGEEIEK
jgi:hypothetical protein